MPFFKLVKAPVGLLGRFDIKQDGRNPPSFSDVIQPQTDVGDYYGLNDLQVQLATGSVQSAGADLDLTVPSGFTWRVLSVGYRVANVLPGDGIVAFIGWRFNASAAIAPIVAGQLVGAITMAGSAYNYTVGAPLGRPILLPPGGILTGQLGMTQTGPVNASLTAIVQATPT